MTDDGTDDKPGGGPDPRGEASLWREIARANNGPDYAREFAARFDELEASGKDVHGEAAFVASVAEPGARVLDVGCGTGRVAARLAALGYRTTGVDPDEDMIAMARERHSELTWVVAGVAGMRLGTTFDVIVLAGNVIPFVEPATLPEAARRLAAHARPGGLVVCGFGLDRAHLPPRVPVVPLAAYDSACASAGLRLRNRYGGWALEPYEGDPGGYAVSVHVRP